MSSQGDSYRQISPAAEERCARGLAPGSRLGPSSKIMVVSDEIRKCVVFVGFQVASGEMRLAGSAFFVSRAEEGTKGVDIFLATAKHVIDGIRNLGLSEVFIRVNTNQGESVWAKCQHNDWLFHPTDQSVDLALLRTGVPDGWDHLVIPSSMCATSEILRKNEVGLGDEVFVVGLFRHHHGVRKNIPIVRVGNLAAMAEEKVSTKDFGLVDAYLIEARSIGGLSGSPVFLNMGAVRYLDGGVKHARNGLMVILLGLVHGHYDVPSSSVDTVDAQSPETLSPERVNTGIAIVVPMEKIRETIAAHSTGVV